MKQKYLILKSDDEKELTIQEFAEIDKDIYSILCEEKYDYKKIKSAAKKSKEELLSTIRTRNFFPTIISAAQIIEAVADLVRSNSNETIELFINDTDALIKKQEELDVIDDLDDDEEQLDGLLEDTVDAYDENISIKKINSSIKVDDDDVIDDNGDI